MTAKDGSGIFSSPSIFEKYHVPADDEVLGVLLQETGDCELDSLIHVAVELTCGELLLLFERQASTQLDGGIY